jgi:hypothetical protein
MFDNTFNVTYIHRVSYIECIRTHLGYETLNALFSVLSHKHVYTSLPNLGKKCGECFSNSNKQRTLHGSIYEMPIDPRF